MSYGAKERNALMKEHNLTAEEIDNLKKASRRMKQMLAQRRYMAGAQVRRKDNRSCLYYTNGDVDP